MSFSSAVLKVGHVAGTYRPPSRARPLSKTSSKLNSGARPRVEMYRKVVLQQAIPNAGSSGSG